LKTRETSKDRGSK